MDITNYSQDQNYLVRISLLRVCYHCSAGFNVRSVQVTKTALDGLGLKLSIESR